MKEKFSKLGIFSITQTFYQIGTIMLIAVSVLASQTLAPSPSTAAIPLSFSVLGTFVGLFPASYCMKKMGRRNGLLLGTLIGISGAIVSSYALLISNFYLFTFGHLLFGFHQSFLQYLRFVAMESVSQEDRSTALSWILIAGIPAAFIGPLAGLLGRDLFPPTIFLGCFIIMTFVLFLQFLLITKIKKDTHLTENTLFESIDTLPERPLTYHFRNSGLWASLISSSFGFGFMVMLMSAVPIAMKSHGHEMHLSTMVLQWHVLGMYIPSFFSGYLVNKFGSARLIIAGILILAIEVFAALQGTGFLPFAVALILLGVGWNFMFVGGTRLLTDQYRNSEKNTIQAINDSFIYLIAVIATYSSAFLETNIGWFNLNLVSLPFLGIALLTVLYYLKSNSTSKENNIA
ncbi:MFS transporter [Leptospira sp. GIMC2001]|uniref:MFS transporter n=1 Tax=Leptospira sp. GIMC2001 TaxID=1513297 RepID=UPI0004A5C25E|nr:MFS transporter [Leptospira sp. GIMC2001]AID56202.1 putative drug transport transmembrane protein [Leptospira sp. GIMC2001]WCL49644.1 MFS transporter [Leptospira sp. GIMC2001]